MRCRQSILKKSETEIDRSMTNKSKALPSQDSLAGTPSANAMFATIAAVIAASRREDEPRLEEPLSRNRNDIADKICRTFCAAIDLAAMSPYGHLRPRSTSAV
jgi:hypothetical protein